MLNLTNWCGFTLLGYFGIGAKHATTRMHVNPLMVRSVHRCFKRHNAKGLYAVHVNTFLPD